jgi:nucleotide-binding universal stress UspA family protein
MFEKVLIPLDGSEHSERALETAIQIAKKFRSKITLLHVYSVTAPAVIAPEPTTLTRAGFPVVTPEEVAEMVKAARVVGNRILTDGEQKAKSASVGVETVLREGNTVQEIVALAKDGEFNLIVMGARGMSRIRELLMGSVSEGVIKNAHCPIMVVK